MGEPPEGMTWARADIEAVQEERLLKVVQWAYDRSSLTRSIWDATGVTPDDVKSRDQFVERAPFLTSENIRDPHQVAQDPFRGLLCVPLDQVTVIGSTSGTTGLPQPLPQHPGDVRSQAGPRDLQMCGVRPGEIVLSGGAATRSGHLSGRLDTAGAVTVFEDWDPSVAPRLVAAARKYRPVHWSLLNGPLVLALQAFARQTGEDLLEAFSSIRTVIWGGEPLPSRTRRLIEEEWGMSVRSMTSLGNACGTIECEAQDGSHTWEDLVFVECLDPDSGRPVADGGRGELVITTLVDRAAPLIRYRSGDYVQFTTARCSCGLEHGRLKTIGRLGDRVRVAERDVLPSDIWDTVSELPATAEAQFQLVRSRTTDAALAVRVGYNPDAPGGDAVSTAAELSERIQATTGVPCLVEAVPLGEIMRRTTGFKLPRVSPD